MLEAYTCLEPHHSKSAPLKAYTRLEPPPYSESLLLLFIGGVVDVSIKVVVEMLSSFPFCIAKKKVKNNLLTRR